MTEKLYYDILELSKLPLGDIYNIALWFKVDTLNKKKQQIIYEILDAQQQFKPTENVRK